MLMKVGLILLSFSALAQEAPLMVELTPLKDKAELQKLGIKEADINKAIEQSKKDLKEVVGEKEFPKYSPLGVDIEIAKTSLVPTNTDPSHNYQQAFSRLQESLNPALCLEDEKSNINSPLYSFSKNTEGIIQKLEEGVGKTNGGMIYVLWGYNRGYHTDADTTFKTPNGTFTIHDARATDRPSNGVLTYINPTDLTKPQYNIRFGYMVNSKWAVEVGQDHMKWVFVPDVDYKITGNYDKPLWVRNKNPDGTWSNDHQTTFADVQQTGNTDFVRMEHSDGYNYVNSSAIFTQNLFTTKNNRFRVDASAGAGLGVLIPKTKVMMRDTDDASWRIVDNKFKVAGWGGHVDGRLKFSYRLHNGREYFVTGMARGVRGKVNNALFLGSDSGSISQEPIYTLQVIVAGGVSIPVFEKKKKK